MEGRSVGHERRGSAGSCRGGGVDARMDERVEARFGEQRGAITPGVRRQTRDVPTHFCHLKVARRGSMLGPARWDVNA
jgi:hypothetical protein